MQLTLTSICHSFCWLLDTILQLLSDIIRNWQSSRLVGSHFQLFQSVTMLSPMSAAWHCSELLGTATFKILRMEAPWLSLYQSVSKWNEMKCFIPFLLIQLVYGLLFYIQSCIYSHLVLIMVTVYLVAMPGKLDMRYNKICTHIHNILCQGEIWHFLDNKLNYSQLEWPTQYKFRDCYVFAFMETWLSYRVTSEPFSYMGSPYFVLTLLVEFLAVWHNHFIYHRISPLCS